MSDINLGNSNLESFLSDAQKDLKEIRQETGKVIKESEKGIHEKISLYDYIKKLFIIANDIGITYDERENNIRLYTKMGDKKKTQVFNYSPDGYYRLLEKLNIDYKKQYNSSAWFYSETEDLIRCYSMNPPLSKYPNVTISISKNPREYQVDPEIEPFIKDLSNSRFLLIGGTGSGKTTFLNQILYRQKDNSRIAFVEEFRELFPPNDNTFFLEVPEEIPGEPYLFDFVIRKTNLMRINKMYVGELKGSETFSFINNLGAGIVGGSTIHGDSCDEGLQRARSLMCAAGICDEQTCGDMIARAVDYAVYIEHYKVQDIKKLTHVYNKTSGKFQMDDMM